MSQSVMEQVSEDMKKAMKSKDKERLAAVRLVRAALKNAEIEHGELTDKIVIDILSSEAKKRRDSAELYRENDREELAEKEEYQLSVIQEYLPKQLSDQEVAAIVDELIAQTGATSKGDLGKVMGPLMGRIKGRYDGSKVKDIVMEKLS